MRFDLRLGDCLDVLKSLPDNSVDSVVTDPPYGLSFMGKKWDYDVPSVEIWAECLRVLKPGGHMLAFGGTRTYHRLVTAIEDAGFEIRDQIQWIFGSGFPKSLDISKAIDKAAGATREIVGENPNHRSLKETDVYCGQPHVGDGSVTAPSTDAAKTWAGWGTALKPANEPICLARKPLAEKTVAANVLTHGTGGINVDASRIRAEGADLEELNRPNKRPGDGASGFMTSTKREFIPSEGRFPANLILDEVAAEALDEQSGFSSGYRANLNLKKHDSEGSFGLKGHLNHRPQDSGGASRFFYVAKASKSERNAGLEGFEAKEKKTLNDYVSPSEGRTAPKNGSPQQNFHPTVKPIKLMRYLARLITPPNGVVLDPFCGSGSTGVAALLEGFKFLGIEREKSYFDIAEARIQGTL